MTDIVANANTRPAGGAAALFRHARYVIGENPITGLSFGLFLLIVIAAMVGPWIVPYSPLASDTSAALKPPSIAHLFGTDQLGRDIFSRVVAATRLDFAIAIRTAVCCGGKIYFQVGAGIVADSSPEAEYDETMAKAAGFLAALQQPLASHATHFA